MPTTGGGPVPFAPTRTLDVDLSTWRYYTGAVLLGAARCCLLPGCPAWRQLHRAALAEPCLRIAAGSWLPHPAAALSHATLYLAPCRPANAEEGNFRPRGLIERLFYWLAHSAGAAHRRATAALARALRRRPSAAAAAAAAEAAAAAPSKAAGLAEEGAAGLEAGEPGGDKAAGQRPRQRRHHRSVLGLPMLSPGGALWGAAPDCSAALPAKAAAWSVGRRAGSCRCCCCWP